MNNRPTTDDSKSKFITSQKTIPKGSRQDRSNLTWQFRLQSVSNKLLGPALSDFLLEWAQHLIMSLATRFSYIFLLKPCVLHTFRSQNYVIDFLSFFLSPKVRVNSSCATWTLWSCIQFFSSNVTKGQWIIAPFPFPVSKKGKDFFCEKNLERRSDIFIS